MTTPITTSTTDSQMHSNIMAARSRDRPPMLATGRYAQWQSRFLRYIDTRPNGDALRKCILKGPYTPSTVIIPAIPATDDSPEVPEQTAVETILNMSPENKEHYQSEKEAIHFLLTRIGDGIYLTGESLNIQDVKTNLFWEFGKFTSHDGESMESYYSRFYKMMNEMIRNNLTVATMQVNVQFLQQLQPEWSRFVTIFKQNHDLDTVSYHKLFDILKQYQKEVNEIRAERIAKNANPLALVAAAQPYLDLYYQEPKSHKSYAPPSKQSSSTRSNATTKYKGKEIAKPITPPSESTSEENSDPKQAQKDKDMQRNLALIAKYFKKIYKPTNNNLRTSSNSRNKNVDTSPRKLKRVKDYTYHKEKMLLCKQAEKGVPLQAEQADWLEETDEEIDEQELEAHYSYIIKIQERHHSKQPESISNTCVVEKVDSNVILDSPDMCDNDIQTEQYAKECDDKRVIVQLILFIVDSGCTKHMTGNLKLLCNFVEKYLGIIYFSNDQFAPILGYGDLVQGNITINRVYYVKSLNHTLFSVGQFCDADLEVAFWKSNCFVINLQGNNLLTDNHGYDLYTISLQETTSSTPIYFMAKALPTQA
ncbi:hypothetical protein Tco_0611489 [Tanacetum coccineum]